MYVVNQGQGVACLAIDISQNGRKSVYGNKIQTIKNEKNPAIQICEQLRLPISMIYRSVIILGSRTNILGVLLNLARYTFFAD